MQNQGQNRPRIVFVRRPLSQLNYEIKNVASQPNVDKQQIVLCPADASRKLKENYVIQPSGAIVQNGARIVVAQRPLYQPSHETRTLNLATQPNVLEKHQSVFRPADAGKPKENFYVTLSSGAIIQVQARNSPVSETKISCPRIGEVDGNNSPFSEPSCPRLGEVDSQEIGEIGRSLPAVSARKSLSLKRQITTSPSIKILKALQSSDTLSSAPVHGNAKSIPPAQPTLSQQPPPALSKPQDPLATSTPPDSLATSKPPDSLATSKPPDPEVLQNLLQETLPPKYSHKVLSVLPLPVYHSSDFDQSCTYEAIVRLNISSKEEALKWLSDYQDSSLTDWRIRRTFKENSMKLTYRTVLRCHNNTQAQCRPSTKQAHEKHTECQASLSITIKNQNMKRSKDKFLKTDPCEIIIQHCHNHPLDAVENLRFRRPKPEVVEKFHELFRNKHSPSSALKTHLFDIRVNHHDNWFEVLADRAQCPTLQWCFHQFYKQFKEAYGSPDGEEMLKSLNEAILKFNADCESECASMKVIDKDLVVVICSPLMERVHLNLKSSGEMAFLDSGGCMDRHGTRVFTFLAPSVAGALPTGLFMTSSESQSVVLEAINLLKSLLPPSSFYGNKMPKVIMTDDSACERNAFRDAFPGVILLLCLFLILQAFWRYVWDGKHLVPAKDRIEVYFLFREWVYVDDKVKFEEMFKSILEHPKIKHNVWVVEKIKEYYQRKDEWALCYRNDLLVRGNNTDNYSERTIRSYKDDVLDRLKAYSVVQLFDFLTTRLTAFFELRIAAVLNNRKVNYRQSKHFIDPKKLVPLECSQTSFEGLYSVSNKQTGGQYFVDMEMEVCSCPVGFNGAPCKHQQAVQNHFNLSSSQFLPFHDEQAKLVLHIIMTTTAPRPGWYAPLKGGPGVKEVPAGSDNDIISNDEIAESTVCETDSGTHGARLMTANCDVEAAQAAWASVNEYIINGLKDRADVFLPAVVKSCEKF